MASSAKILQELGILSSRIKCVPLFIHPNCIPFCVMEVANDVIF